MAETRPTVPIRLPDDTAASLKRVAALNGITPAEQMDRAWTWWWNRWGVEAPTYPCAGCALDQASASASLSPESYPCREPSLYRVKLGAAVERVRHGLPDGDPRVDAPGRGGRR